MSKAEERRREAELRARRDILDAALRVFAAKGYRAATMSEIATGAGFTASSLYTYYAGKADMFTALAQDFGEALMEAVGGPLPAAGTPRERLVALLEPSWRLMESRPDTFRFFLRLQSTGEGLPTEFIECEDTADPRGAMQARLIEFFTAEQAAGRVVAPAVPETCAAAVLGLQMGLMERCFDDGTDLTPAKALEVLGHVVFGGLLTD